MAMQHGPLNDGSGDLEDYASDDAATNITATDLINILDAVEVPVIALRRDSAISHFNKAAAEALGLSQSDAGRLPSDIPALAALPLLEKRCRDIIAGGLEARVNCRAGKESFVVRISPLREFDGKITGTVLTFTDVTAFRASIDQAIYEREFTKAILNTVADPLIVLGADQRIETGNHAFYAMFGVSRDETQGRPFCELGNGAPELASFREQLTEMFAAGSAFQPVEVDNVFTARGSRTFILEAHPLVFPGHAEKILVTLRDITERKQAEVLRASEHNLRLIVDSIPGLICIMTEAGEFDLANRQLLDYTGKTLDEMKEWPAIVHADDLRTVVSRLQTSFETGCRFDAEVRVRRADAEYRWFHCCGLPLRDETGRVVRWYELFTDIEDRKHAEQALRASEINLRHVIDSISGLVCTMSPAGVTELVNRPIMDYFGKTFEELQGWTLGSDAVHPDDFARVISEFRNSITTGAPFDTEVRLRRFDGVYRWFHNSGRPVKDAGGRITGWYFLMTDIEDRKRAEEALRASERNLSLTINSIPALTWSARIDGSAEFFNQYYLDYVGLTQEQAQGWGGRRQFTQKM